MKKTHFQAAVEFFLDNLFDIVTIGVAGYLVVRHQVKPFTNNDIPELLTGILAVLGFVAVSGLWDRNRRLQRIEHLSTESRDLVLHKLSGKVSADDFFLSERKISDDTFASANEIFISGVTLTRTTREYMYILGQRLKAGAHIRIIIVDPELDAVMSEFSLRSTGNTTSEDWQNRIKTVDTVIDVIATTPGNTGKLEVGYLPYTPSFGLIIIDPGASHSTCFVEIYHHKSPEPNPAFMLKKSDDPYWYDFFLRQYENLWDSCRTKALS
jgi:hypothetical protein